MIKRKFYLEKIVKLIDTEDIKVITGVRRCGKTVLLKQIIDELENRGIASENIIYMSFESSKYKNIRNDDDLDEFIFSKTNNLNGKIYLLFDEIQKVKNWEVSLNSYRVDLECDIYITGSNSQLLSGELATLISGRYISINMLPFSFKEYLQYNGDMNIDEALNKYVREGGMSGSYLYKEEEQKYKYILEVYNTLIVRDIREKYKIKNTELLDNLANFMMDNISNITSVRNITNSLNKIDNKLNHKTIGSYIDCMVNAYLFYKIKRYDIQGKKYLESQDKYYLVDPTFKFAKLGTKNMNYGRVYENIVAIELLRRGYEVYVGQMYNSEIDFVAMKRNEKIYIQVSDNISDDKTLEREVKSLLKIKDAYPKILVARTMHDTYQYEGVQIYDIAKWLLK